MRSDTTPLTPILAARDNEVEAGDEVGAIIKVLGELRSFPLDIGRAVLLEPELLEDSFLRLWPDGDWEAPISLYRGRGLGSACNSSGAPSFGLSPKSGCDEPRFRDVIRQRR